ncbi:acylneuraminate cytidylyltransferase family protein [Azotosporobacter soli]|uniref:acylneuraminate cytidylyltransferase family protein n=1 Tax=Azotosporobacter soli TaxID=3055040 RepID=UPI0031FF17EF
MKRICTICARAGSKGVKNKNIRMLAGKPLIAHSILQAKATMLFDAIAVSSDSEEILTIAKQWGADFIIQRPMEMATDTAGKLPAIRHCLEEAEKQSGIQFDIVVDLDCTSPLRLPEDILGSVHLLEESGATNVITGAPARRSPYFNLVEELENGEIALAKVSQKPILRRQDAPRCYDMNASIYVWTAQSLRENQSLFQTGTRLYVMPEERSIDIDSELDFSLVEFLMARKMTIVEVGR